MGVSAHGEAHARSPKSASDREGLARALLTQPPMKLQLPSWMARQIGTTIEEVAECELERMLVAGAVVQRQGNHYWIVSGGEPLADLPASWAPSAADAELSSEPI